jgi:glycine/D-amino acid oxidase-like deaminating enzyme
VNAERTYDTAVIGAGVFGAWTAYRLRESGQSVALLDGYGPANSRASSGGESRIIRMGYGADEVYTRRAACTFMESPLRCAGTCSARNPHAQPVTHYHTQT